MYNTIKELCKARGITVSKMCAEIRISPTVMSELHTGRTKSLSAPTIQKIADYLGVSPADIMGKKEKLTDDDELNEYLEMLRQRPGMRALLKVHKGSTDEEIAANVRFIEELRGMKND